MPSFAWTPTLWGRAWSVRFGGEEVSLEKQRPQGRCPESIHEHLDTGQNKQTGEQAILHMHTVPLSPAGSGEDVRHESSLICVMVLFEEHLTPLSARAPSVSNKCQIRKLTQGKSEQDAKGHKPRIFLLWAPSSATMHVTNAGISAVIHPVMTEIFDPLHRAHKKDDSCFSDTSKRLLSATAHVPPGFIYYPAQMMLVQ